MLGNVHRGERRVGEGAQRQVVKADDRDVLWHAHAVFAQRAHGTHGEHVVLGKEGRRQVVARDVVEPRAHIEISALERGAQCDAPCRVGLKARVLKCLAIAALAILKVANAKVAC